MADDLWRHKVDQDILLLKEGQALSRTALAENTALTKEGLGRLEGKLDEQIKETKPVVDTLHTMEGGIRTIQTIGRWGGRVFKGGLYLAGGWFFVKALVGGASLDAAAAVFAKIISGTK